MLLVTNENMGLCLYIPAFQNSSNRGRKNLYENMFEKEPEKSEVFS